MAESTLPPRPNTDSSNFINQVATPGSTDDGGLSLGTTESGAAAIRTERARQDNARRLDADLEAIESRTWRSDAARNEAIRDARLRAFNEDRRLLAERDILLADAVKEREEELDNLGTLNAKEQAERDALVKRRNRAAASQAVAVDDPVRQPTGSGTLPEGTTITVQHLDNPLSMIDQPAYHWSFYSIPLKRGPYSINDRGDQFREYLKVLDDELNDRISGNIPTGGEVGKFLIAETAASGFNIESVELDAVVAPNFDTQNVGAMKWKMVIREVGGLSLSDTLFFVGKVLNKNPMKSPYILELKFHGYDSAGNHVWVDETYGYSRQASDIGQGQPKSWLWKVYITKVDTEYGVGGAIHTLELITASDRALQNDVGIILKPFNAGGDNLQSILDKLATELEKQDAEKYGYTRNKFHFRLSPWDSDNFEKDWFKSGGGQQVEAWPPEINADVFNRMSEWSVNAADLAATIQRNYGTQEGQQGEAGTSFPKGTHVKAIVDTLCGCCNENTQWHLETLDDELRREITFYFYMVPEVELWETETYDPFWGDYNRRYHYFIMPHISRQAMKARKQADDLPIESRNQLNFLKIIFENRIKKVYDYIYTGLNTEVEQFDIKFESAWYAVTTLFEGSSKQSFIEGTGAVSETGEPVRRAQRAHSIATGLGSTLEAGRNTEAALNAIAADESTSVGDQDDSPATRERIAAVESSLNSTSGVNSAQLEATAAELRSRPNATQNDRDLAAQLERDAAAIRDMEAQRDVGLQALTEGDNGDRNDASATLEEILGVDATGGGNSGRRLAGSLAELQNRINARVNSARGALIRAGNADANARLDELRAAGAAVINENRILLAEDFNDPALRQELEMAWTVTFENDIVSDAVTEGNVPPPLSLGRSFYAALANQTYSGVVEKNLMKIKMAINGDPYWLGRTHAEDGEESLGLKEPEGTQDTNPRMNSGGNYILFRFNLPQTIDENTGQPLLTKSGLFTGLYQVIRCKHMWEGGRYKQELECVLSPSFNLFELKVDVAYNNIPEGANAAAKKHYETQKAAAEADNARRQAEIAALNIGGTV